MRKIFSFLICSFLMFSVIVLGSFTGIKAEESEVVNDSSTTPTSNEVTDNNTWWNEIVSKDEAEILAKIKELPQTQVGSIGFDGYGEQTYLSSAVLEAMKNKGLAIFTSIDSNNPDVLKHFQTMGGVINSNLENFTPYFEEYINDANINKTFGINKSVGIEFEYSGILPDESIVNVNFNGNLFNIESDKDKAIDVYQINENGEIVATLKGSLFYTIDNDKTNVHIKVKEGGSYLVSDQKPVLVTETQTTPTEGETTPAVENIITPENKTKGVNTSDSTNVSGLFLLMLISGASIYSLKKRNV